MLFLIFALLAGLGVKRYIDQQNYHSFDYQYEMAQTALTRGDYEEALAFARRAVSLDGGSEAARLLETDILCQMGQSEEASRILRN